VVNPPLRVRWLSDRELLVGYGAQMKLRRLEAEVDGVAVRYKTLE